MKKKTRTARCLFCNTTKGLEWRPASWGGYWQCPEKKSQDCPCRRHARVAKASRDFQRKHQAKQLAGLEAMEQLEARKKAKAKR